MVYSAERQEDGCYWVYKAEFVRRNHSWFHYRDPGTSKEFAEQREWRRSQGDAWQDALCWQIAAIRRASNYWGEQSLFDLGPIRVAEGVLDEVRHLQRVKRIVEKIGIEAAQAIAEMEQSAFCPAI